MASDTATERYSSPAVHHDTISAKTTRDTKQQPTIKRTSTSRATSTDDYLQGFSTGHYHQRCSTEYHHQGCSSRTATCARTSSTQDKGQEIQTITGCSKPYRVMYTFENDCTGSTHAGTTGNIMLGPKQRNGEIHDVHTATPSPTICKKWDRSFANEMGQLFLGIIRKEDGQQRIKGTNTFLVIYFQDIPKTRINEACYTSVLCKERPGKSDPNRTRITICGTNVQYPGDLGTKTA